MRERKKARTKERNALGEMADEKREREREKKRE